MQERINKFAQNLKKLRKKKGLTQKRLAESLNISEKSVSKWEVGAALPPSVLLPDLAAELGVSINVLFEYSDSPKYFLGIDGGGTKTEFLLEDALGNTVNHLILGPSNPVDIGLEACFKVLSDGINNVCNGIPKGEISLFVGLAGGMSGSNKESISKFLSQFGFVCFANGSDTENALETALAGDNGVAVIMGTGIIAFSQNNGKRTRIGGWGYLLDSGGSGYNLGRDALEYALRYFDSRGEKTILLELIEQKIGRSIPEAIPQIYSKGKSYIAQFAPTVFEAIEKGDRVAYEILRKNIEALAEIIKVGKSHIADNDPVVICGGLAKKKDVIIGLLDEILPDNNVCFCDEPMVKGAVSLARKGVKNA